MIKHRHIQVCVFFFQRHLCGDLSNENILSCSEYSILYITNYKMFVTHIFLWNNEKNE